MHDPYRALYIHIPFCKSRCGYCDFATQALDSESPLIDEYIDALILEIRRASREEKLGKIETVYLGGGTPSYLGSARLSKLLYTLSLSLHLEPSVECTLEANPESLTESMIKDVWALGVNRLSIGVQTFDDELLKTLGRPHDAHQVQKALKLAKTRFDNVSVDIMCGIPGQSPEMFENDLRLVLESEIQHVSIYPLTIEKGTSFHKLVKKGALPKPDEDDQASMMERARCVLEPDGFLHYEVASYALPGFESRHNCAYWTGKPYLGFGKSAVTMTQDSVHRMRVQDGRVIEELKQDQMCAEDLMLGMRMSQGVSEEQVTKARELLPRVCHVFDELVSLGLVRRELGRYRPTTQGWLCGNELYGRIYNLAP